MISRKSVETRCDCPLISHHKFSPSALRENGTAPSRSASRITPNSKAARNAHVHTVRLRVRGRIRDSPARDQIARDVMCALVARSYPPAAAKDAQSFRSIQSPARFAAPQDFANLTTEPDRRFAGHSLHNVHSQKSGTQAAAAPPLRG